MTVFTQQHWDALRRSIIGLDQLHQFASAANGSNYPPHNLEQVSDDHFRLTLAVAGFAESEIAISVHEGILTIKGTATRDDRNANYVYRGLSMRDFSREFKLGEYCEVTQASLSLGILTIDLKRLVPESQKPRLIPIIS